MPGVDKVHTGQRLPTLSFGQQVNLGQGSCFRRLSHWDRVSPPQEIPASPFRVKVDPSHDASKVKAEGPGLSRAGKGVGRHPRTLLLASGSGSSLWDLIQWNDTQVLAVSELWGGGWELIPLNSSDWLWKWNCCCQACLFTSQVSPSRCRKR